MHYPPLTLAVNVELDEHTREFFDPKYQSAPAQAVVELRTLDGRFFVARLAPLRLNWAWQRRPFPESEAEKPLHDEIAWLPVFREIHYDTQGKWIIGNTCLVSFYEEAPRLPRGEVLYPRQIEEFWRDNIAIVGKTSLKVSYNVFFGESITLAHCYYHPSGLGLAMFEWGRCWLAGLQESSQDLREDVHSIDLSVEWNRENPNDEHDVSDDYRDVTDLSDKETQAEIEALLDKRHSKLASAVEFYQTEEEQRCWEVLQCSSRVRHLAQKRCEVEVLCAIGARGALDDCIWVRCTPWVDKPLTVVTNDGRVLGVEIPALQQRLAAICSDLGATLPIPAPVINGSPESLRQKVCYDWASRLHFEVEAVTGHEIAVRISLLLAEIEALEAETAATRTA